MQGNDLTEYLITIGLMIILVIGLGIGIFMLRGRLFGSDERADADAGGMLETMRRMRDRGEIPEEEYRAAQAAMVARAAAARDQARGHPATDRTPAPAPGELRARPGFDLTGAPLPRPVRDDDHGGGEEAR